MTSSTNRNVRFYERLADRYDLFFHDLEENMKEEGEWLARALAPHSPVTLLDASAGSGRQAIPLARLGYRVWAADPSESMLARGRDSAHDEGIDIHWVCAPFVELPGRLNATFDAVIALGNGLCNQETRQEIAASLAALRLCTAPSGICLVGIKDYDALRSGFESVRGHGTRDEHGQRTVLFDLWEIREPHLVSTSFLVEGRDQQWEVETTETREYMLSRHELEGLARAAGFRTVELLEHPTESVYRLRP